MRFQNPTYWIRQEFYLLLLLGALSFVFLTGGSLASQPNAQSGTNATEPCKIVQRAKATLFQGGGEVEGRLREADQIAVFSLRLRDGCVELHLNDLGKSFRVSLSEKDDVEEFEGNAWHRRPS